MFDVYSSHIYLEILDEFKSGERIFKIDFLIQEKKTKPI